MLISFYSLHKSCPTCLIFAAFFFSSDFQQLQCFVSHCASIQTDHFSFLSFFLCHLQIDQLQLTSFSQLSRLPFSSITHCWSPLCQWFPLFSLLSPFLCNIKYVWLQHLAVLMTGHWPEMLTLILYSQMLPDWQSVYSIIPFYNKRGQMSWIKKMYCWEFTMWPGEGDQAKE